MAGPSITVRELEPDDWRTWRALRLAALAEAPHAFHSRLEDWLGAGEQEWRDRLAAPNRHLVADLDGRPCGQVVAVPPDETGTADLIALWVAPHARGTGAAEALVSAVLDRAGGWGAGRLALHVVVGNERAAALYRRLGFVDLGPIERPDGITEHRMERGVPRPVSRCR
ncbi:acetyltransferase [Pseudonocardia sp. Ae168_Ps1]|uniref:GNAT family N-acetyltransferase n=1 Tax=unclassified Pseudonocardia TaxID=2619320 RepID=UPI0001FFE6CE|nr:MULTISPECIES: GNAT family N-acetyltransferase [unclassified Pseudonocardia]OLL75739.1 acetyltransferase [Pseudonocardia sp. Ae150A_Ps1]OLL81738.1 acetyltransferase [Pseudonocardia sp. Ae168_Ps1]OLL84151.1 acetyltransferase [Pseudonocardia sp. Ae263_Ps1]OLL95831.1 acetyltransferase [Pseudonocardia sp. Ae356_Ps1]OLM16523.1 acetyltransferase [Pseudonocardia sp. Ae707_Ps1]